MNKFFSRKLASYVVSIVVVLLVKIGVPEEMAGDLVNAISNLTLYYLGSQGLVDVAKAIKGGE